MDDEKKVDPKVEPKGPGGAAPGGRPLGGGPGGAPGGGPGGAPGGRPLGGGPGGAPGGGPGGAAPGGQPGQGPGGRPQPKVNNTPETVEKGMEDLAARIIDDKNTKRNDPKTGTDFLDVGQKNGVAADYTNAAGKPVKLMREDANTIARLAIANASLANGGKAPDQKAINASLDATMARINKSTDPKAAIQAEINLGLAEQEIRTRSLEDPDKPEKKVDKKFLFTEENRKFFNKGANQEKTEEALDKAIETMNKLPEAVSKELGPDLTIKATLILTQTQDNPEVKALIAAGEKAIEGAKEADITAMKDAVKAFKDKLAEEAKKQPGKDAPKAPGDKPKPKLKGAGGGQQTSFKDVANPKDFATLPPGTNDMPAVFGGAASSVALATDKVQEMVKGGSKDGRG